MADISESFRLMHSPFSHYSASTWDHPVIDPETVTEEWCRLHRLIEELSMVQRRLGTPLESPGDHAIVRDLGHKIRNRLHLMQLWTELGMVRRDSILIEETAV